jgi:hypothetical protein
MLGKVSQIFSPWGSGGFIRRMADAAMRNTREFDAKVIELSPPSFPMEKLGNLLLVYIEEEGQALHARSVKNAPGKDYHWVGRCTPKANLFKLLPFVGDHPIDRQKFLDYVYNFHFILIDLKKQTLNIVDKDSAESMMVTQGGLKVPRVAAITAALG